MLPLGWFSMNFLQISRAALASSVVGGGETGEILLELEPGARKPVVPEREYECVCRASMLMGETSMSEAGDSSIVLGCWGFWVEVAEFSDSASIKGTVCRRRSDAGARMGRRGTFWAGMPGEGPQEDIGLK